MMDNQIVNLDINQLIKERKDGKMLDILSLLKSAYCVKSMSLSESQKNRYFSPDFWKEVHTKEK